MAKKRMTWKEASAMLLKLLDDYGQDWPAKYREAVLIGIERIQEVEDLEGTEDYE